MNDLSAAPTQPRPPRPRVALLVDGDNISPGHAGGLILGAARHGDVTIRRVYGNVTLIPGWGVAPGFRLIHSGSGKNATDLLLAVEAMALMLRGLADVLAIASSDRDFTHLATHLREAGMKVIGLGEAKTAEGFRKACSQFHTLALASPPPAAPAVPDKPTTLQHKVQQLILDEGQDGSMQIVKLGAKMASQHKVKIGSHPAKTWRAFLLTHPALFQCDARGPDARVHLKS